MKKLLIAIVAVLMLVTPANAWYRGGYGGYGWRGPVYNNYNYYGGGWGNYGAAVGIGAGAALLGGVIGGAIASQPYYGGYGYGGYYGGYYCQRYPVYDAWGRTVGFSC